MPEEYGARIVVLFWFMTLVRGISHEEDFNVGKLSNAGLSD